MLEASGRASFGVHMVHSDVNPQGLGWSWTVILPRHRTARAFPEHLLVRHAGGQSLRFWKDGIYEEQ